MSRRVEVRRNHSVSRVGGLIGPILRHFPDDWRFLSNLSSRRFRQGGSSIVAFFRELTDMERWVMSRLLMNSSGTIWIEHNGASPASMTAIDPAATIKAIAKLRLVRLIPWAGREQCARE